MSLLSLASSGQKIGPQFNVIFGLEGVGKTTFASKFEKPIIFDLEDGSNHLDITRLGSKELVSLTAFNQALDEILAGGSPFKTLIIDSITVLEQMIHRHLCGSKFDTIEDVGGGFGKGYTMAREEMGKILKKLQAIKQLGLNVIMIGHTQVKAFTDPGENQTYDRFTIQCNEKLGQLVKSTADNVFFIKYAIDTTIDSKTKKTQAFGDGARKMLTEWRPGADAKNRLNLPYEMPLDYQAFKAAIEAGKPKSAPDLIEDIKRLAGEVKADSSEKALAAMEKAGSDVEKLKSIKSRLLELAKNGN